MSEAVQIRKLEYADGEMVESLVHRVFHSKGRLSLHHSPNLFHFYKFISGQGSFEDVHFWGAFSGTRTMIGVTGFVNYELGLEIPRMKCFYNSDSLVVPEHMGRGIYPQLLDRQIEFFNSAECVPLSWGIEHIPGKLKGLKTYLEKNGGMEVRFLGHSRGFNVLLSQPLAGELTVYKKVLLKSMPVIERELFLQQLLHYREGSAFYPRIDSSRFDRILQLDPDAYVIQTSSEHGQAGLLAVDLKEIRQYYRLENFAPTQHWSMYWSEKRNEQSLKELFAVAYEAARTKGAQVAVVRDIPLGVAKIFREVTLEPKRLFAVTRQRDHELFAGLEDRVGDIALDALFL